jgi:hypothetical protein
LIVKRLISWFQDLLFQIVTLYRYAEESSILHMHDLMRQELMGKGGGGSQQSPSPGSAARFKKLEHHQPLSKAEAVQVESS